MPRVHRRQRIRVPHPYPLAVADVTDSTPKQTSKRTASIGPAVLDHVAFGVPQIDPAAALLITSLGAEPYMSGPGVQFRGAQVRTPGGGVIEFIEPDKTPDGFLARFLRMHGPGIHHATFKVPKIEIARDALEASGYEIVGFDDSSAAWKEMFLHPKQAMGIVVQIAETDPTLEDGWDDSWPYSVRTAPATPIPVRGFRLNAFDADAARRQWGQILGGHHRNENGIDLFEWPNSPLRIAVQSDPDLPEGPVGIEIKGKVARTDGIESLLDRKSVV